MLGHFDPERHHRRSIRLPRYDYRQAGAYFVTICVYERECLFGEVVGGAMSLSSAGEVATEEWWRTMEVRARVSLYADEFVVMPNHVHGIVRIGGVDARDDGGVMPGADALPGAGEGAQRRCAPTLANGDGGLGAMMADGDGAGGGDEQVRDMSPGVGAFPGVGAQRRCAPTLADGDRGLVEWAKSTPSVTAGSLGAIVRAYKAVVTRRINATRGMPGAPVWQRNYYEHVIRDEASLDRIRDYIMSNPARWDQDALHPVAVIRRGDV